MGRMEECYICLHELHSFLTNFFFNEKSVYLLNYPMMLFRPELFYYNRVFFYYHHIFSPPWTVQSLFSKSSIILALLLGYYKQCELVVLRLVWNLSWIMLKLELKYVKFLIISLIPDFFMNLAYVYGFLCIKRI